MWREFGNNLAVSLWGSNALPTMLSRIQCSTREKVELQGMTCVYEVWDLRRHLTFRFWTSLGPVTRMTAIETALQMRLAIRGLWLLRSILGVVQAVCLLSLCIDGWPAVLAMRRV